MIDLERDYEKIKNIFVSPDTVSELKSLLGLSLYEKKFKTNGVFDDNKEKVCI